MLKKILTVTAAMAVSVPAFAADLSLSFLDALPADGPLMVAVHNSAATFSGGEAAGAVAALLLPPGTTGLVINGLAPGRYAVKAFQDTDGDRMLNVGTDRRPTEPVAVSGKVTGGWPDFSSAAIGVETSANVELRFKRP